MKKIGFKITHNGKDWVVENRLLTASSATLDDLDKRVGALLREKGLIKEGERAEIVMEFDNSTIPQWIRQYSSHYFDRIVKIEG